MTDSSDLIKLYSARILELAAALPLTDRLAKPTGTAMARSPLCGSKVTVDVVVEDGVITAYGQDVKACALGQAAASVVGSHVIGATRDEVQAGRDALAAMLAGEADAVPGRFEGLSVLQPASAYKNRHASILLAFDACLDAAHGAQGEAAGTA